ncbi:DUF2716 domain-containing protein [Microbacterium sp. NPDC089695]|uniref:DUF2716 domain-containing protein n=1 Tax=Microbacterium sp. NPDC089695 TaxID=3364198 RepID=UPI0038248971
MSTASSSRPGWREMDPADRESAWDRFEARYGFRASVDPSGWPAISEPTPSITFDLSAIPSGPELVAAFAAVNAEALRCFVWALGDVDEFVVLDWQHTGWWFDPRLDDAPVQWDDVNRSQPTVFPDGDYFAFLSPDLSEGTFGHPWEQTLCVMGERLVGTLGRTLATWLPVVRVDDAITTP